MTPPDHKGKLVLWVSYLPVDYESNYLEASLFFEEIECLCCNSYFCDLQFHIDLCV